MGGEGHMLDMIRRLSEGREASRLRRERTSEKLKHMQRTNETYPLPDTTPEEMGHIIQETAKRKKRENSYFVWGSLIIMGILIASAVIIILLLAI